MFTYFGYCKLLKDKRLQMGLSQERAASLIGISRSFYSEVENGKKAPSIHVLEKINGIIPIIFLNYSVDNTCKN